MMTEFKHAESVWHHNAMENVRKEITDVNGRHAVAMANQRQELYQVIHSTKQAAESAVRTRDSEIASRVGHVPRASGNEG